MIEIQLSELDIELEVAELPEHQFTVEETGDVALQGPIDFGAPEPEPSEWGFLDLDLLGFPYHGLSAYEVALKNGFIGTEAEWLASLKGEPGDLSPEGRDAVNLATSEANRAGGHATAAASHEFTAFTYAGTAGIHAASALSAFTNAVAARDETNQIASAMTLIRQSSEALLIGAQELATATIQERVAAETARSEAELARDRTAISETNAEGSSASASDNATMAVEARNIADDRANAAVLAESNAQAYATDAFNEASAASQARIIASAARDQAQITAQGVVIEVQKAEAFASDSEAFSLASRDERIAAEAAFAGATGERQQAANHAQASLDHSVVAQGHATAAGSEANASQQSRLAAEAANQAADGQRAAAVIARNESVTASQNSETARAAAAVQAGLAVDARNVAGIHAGAAAQSVTDAAAYVDQAGILYGAVVTQYNNIEAEILGARGGLPNLNARLGSIAQVAADATGVEAGRITTLSGRVDSAEGRLTITENVAVDALGKVNVMYGVDLNANGFVTGWRAANNGVTGSFTILGNVFRLVDPNGGTPFTPFEVIGSEAYFNANVRINGNLVVTGTIDTPSLTNNAATKLVAAYNGNTVGLSNNTPTRVHGLYIPVDLATSPIDIDFNCWVSFVHDAGGSFIAYVQLVRSRTDTGGTVLVTVPIYGSGMANDIWQGPVPIKYLDNPGENGLWHYYIQIYTNVTNMTTQSVTARYGKLTELKNNPAASITTGTGSGTGVGAGGGSTGGGGSGGTGGEVTDPGGGGGGTIEEPIYLPP